MYAPGAPRDWRTVARERDGNAIDAELLPCRPSPFASPPPAVPRGFSVDAVALAALAQLRRANRPCHHCTAVGERMQPVDGISAAHECVDVDACEGRILRRLRATA